MILRLFFLLGLMLVLHGVGWFIASVSLKEAVQDWVLRQNQAGILISHDEAQARITGYPFVVKARLKDLIVAPHAQNPPWYWRTDHLDISLIALPFLYDTLEITAQSRHVIETARATYSGTPEILIAQLDWTSASLLPDALEIQLQNLIFENTQTRAKHLIETVSFQAHRQDDLYRYHLKGSGLDLITGVPGLGRKLNDVIVRGFIPHTERLHSFQPQDLINWRDNGGVVEVERLKIRAGALDVQGNGTLALDADLQPVGAMSGRFQGFFQVVDRLTAKGLITRPNASLAKVVLGALAKRPENGGALTISLPITLKDRTLYTGPVRLAEFPKIHW